MLDTVLLEYEGTFGHGRSLDDIVSWVDALPPMPDVSSRALRLVDDPNATPEDLAKVLMRDPVLTSSLMRAANSAALGRASIVESLDQAILVLGMSALKSTLLACILRKWNKNFGPVEKLVWDKSLGTAIAAQVIASYMGKPPPNEARLVGLLHNLGQIVMLTHPEVRKEYPRVLQYIKDRGVDYATAEREIIGFSYPLVGALVARRWQIPMLICNSILRHSDPLEGIESEQDEQIALTKLAVSLSLQAGIGRPEGHPLIDPSVEDAAIVFGFEEAHFNTDFGVLSRQARKLFTAEANAYM